MKADGRRLYLWSKTLTTNVESDPLFNRQAWINSWGDLEYNMPPRTCFMAGTFVNKIYTLKSSESEELIFILTNHIYLKIYIFCHWPHTWRLGLSWKTQSVSQSLPVSPVLAEKCFLIWFLRPQCVSKNYLGEVTKSWLAVNLVYLLIVILVSLAMQSFNGILSWKAAGNHKSLCKWKRVMLLLQHTALLQSLSSTFPMEIRPLG